jgi:hypothetical protein
MQLLIRLKQHILGFILIITSLEAESQALILKRSTLGTGGASVTVTAEGNKIIVPQSIGQVSVTGVFTGSDLELRQGFIQPVLMLKSFPEADEKPVTVWPNPFSSEVNVKLEKEMTGVIDLDLIDLTGRLVFSERISAEGTIRINLSLLASGIYVLRIRNYNFLFNYQIIKD